MFVNSRLMTAAMLLLAGIGPAGAGAAGDHVFENAKFKYVISAAGRNAALIDKQSGKNYAAKADLPFASIRLAGKDLSPTSCALEQGKLRLFFPAGVVVVIGCRVEESCLVFEVESLSDPAVEELALVNLPLALFRDVSGMSGLAGDGDFAVVLRSLDLKSLGQAGGTLRAVCPRQYGITGARIALVGSPVATVRDALKDLLRREGQPQSPLGGPWALDAPENRGSYLFADVSESDVDEWIALAKKAGIAQIHFIGWERGYGHYQPRPERFPHGLDGMKAAVHKIHKAGLRAGLHTLTGCISESDSWVTPVPDPRLARDARLTLAAPLDAAAQFVPTGEPPGEFDTIWAYSGRGNVLRIDGELIQYEAIDRQSPKGFGKCRRGAFGTRPAPHAAGAAVDHLYVRYLCFQPDETSTLVDGVAQAIAQVFNTCGFDMIYMDGAEGMPGGWWGIARMREALFRSLKGRVLVEASEWGYHSWPFHSRLGAWDYPNWGLKRFTDEHCRSGEFHRRTALLPTQLGWWAILGPNGDHPGEFPDEIEYLCAKSLAWDQPMSFQGISPGKTPSNARQDEYLELIGQYERLRLANAFSQAARERLREEKADFRLVRGDGGWAFAPTDYAAHKVTGLEDGSQSWTVSNRHGGQPAQLRIEALYGVAPYDSTGTLVLADFSKPDEFGDLAAEGGVKPSFDISREQVKAGAASGRYQAHNDHASPKGAWSRAVRKFEPEVSLSGREALGVWIHGDGKGELLNLQLTNPPQYWPTCDEHYVKIDFEGWRYFELLLRERDADLYADYVWPYSYHSMVYRNPLIKEHTSALNLYFNNLPPRETATCYLGPIKALPVGAISFERPSLVINGRRMEFPVTMASGSYLELGRDGAWRLYDERGALLRQAALADIPPLKPGENSIQFACQAAKGVRPRAKVTLITSGETFR